MQIDTVAEGAQAYDAHPWLERYPADVPAHIDAPEGSIWDLLTEIAARDGDRTAFLFQHYGMTFRQLLRHSERLSHALARAGVRHGDVVLAVLPNVPHFPLVYYAVTRLGAAIAAAPPTSVERELEGFIRDTGARTVITIDLLFDKIAGVWESCEVENVIVGKVTDFMPPWTRVAGRFSSRVPKPKSPVPYGPHIRPMLSFMRGGRGGSSPTATSDDVAILLYTGGTTGTPKAAMLTHKNLLTNARQMVTWFPSLQKSDQTILAVMPFFHAYGLTLVMNAGLLLGARSVLIAGGWVPAEIFEAIQRYRPTIFPGVPTMYVGIINDERSRAYDLSSIDVCVTGGAPLPIEVKRDFERLTGGHLYEGYGMTEASPVTHAQPHDESGKLGSIGLPVPDTEARIVDENDIPVPVGEDGELVIRGPQVMRGYWNRPEETAEALRGGWLHTGDIARMDSEGYFFIVDRKKDLIITGGENIYPREIEEVLFEHPKVKEAAVCGVPHPFGGEIAKAFIVLKPGETATKKDIVQFASERLAKHKVPRAVEFRDDLPKSLANKVLRRVLVEEEIERQERRKARKAESEE